MTTENISQSLPFRVGDVRLLKESEDGVFKTYRIDVDFKKGRGATFDLRVKSLKVALEAIHAFGKQIETLESADFYSYLERRQGKTFYMDMQNTKPETGEGDDVVTGFKQSRGNSGHVEYLWGFRSNPGSPGVHQVKISQEELRHLNELAKSVDVLRRKKIAFFRTSDSPFSGIAVPGHSGAGPSGASRAASTRP